MFCKFFKRISSHEFKSLKLCNSQNSCQVVPSTKLYLVNSIPFVNQFHTSPSYNRMFWEKQKRDGYSKTSKYLTNYEHFLDGFRDLKEEVVLWKNEMKERINFHPVLLYRPGETDIIWRFDNNEILENFVTASDRDHKEGFSRCKLELSEAGRALFSGTLEYRVPKDGRIKRSGYCAMRSLRARKSFRREANWNWSMYNTLVMRVRGDGRSYLLNLSTEGYFDVTWNDIYNYVLYTRGGPYWQTVKIPFSKFMLSSKGRIQDQQGRIPLDRISHFGISCGEKVEGSFSLEIEYIGLEFNPEHDEHFAYEMYRTDRNITAH